MEESTADSDLELTRDELHDLVPIRRLDTAVDANFLVTVLQEGGFPAIVHSDNTMFAGLRLDKQRLLVPRKLAGKAKAYLRDKEREGQKSGLEYAFSDQMLEEYFQTENPDPMFDRMFQMREREPGDRDEELAKLVAEWLMSQWPPVRVAEHLALAGLTRGQVESLVKWVL